MITGPPRVDTEFVPGDLVHRQNDLTALSESVLAALRDGNGGCSYVFGPSGSGKACLAGYLLADLQAEHGEVRTQYINAWQQHAPLAFLSQLIGGDGSTHDIDEGSTSHDALLDQGRERDAQLYVVVIDEVDQLDAMELLCDLNRMHHVHLILIANQEGQFFAGLDDRLAVAGRTAGAPRPIQRNS